MIFYFCIMAIILIGSFIYAAWLISFGSAEFASGKRFPIRGGSKPQEENHDVKRIQELETLERNHRIYKEK